MHVSRIDALNLTDIPSQRRTRLKLYLLLAIRRDRDRLMEVDITLSKCCFVHSKKVSAFVYLPPQAGPPLYSELHVPGEWYI